MILHIALLDLPPLETNAYLLADESTSQALLVDAGKLTPELPALVDRLGLTVTDILLTHLHWDHVDGLPDYLRQWPAARVISPAPPRADLLPPGFDAVVTVAEPDRVTAAGFEFQVFRTSGHTPDSISYYCPAAGLCFVGDAIFAGAVGGTSSDALFAEQVGHLNAKLMQLPDATRLLSGHGPPTTVAIESAANPFLRPGFGR